MATARLAGSEKFAVADRRLAHSSAVERSVEYSVTAAVDQVPGSHLSHHALLPRVALRKSESCRIPSGPVALEKKRRLNPGTLLIRCVLTNTATGACIEFCIESY